MRMRPSRDLTPPLHSAVWALTASVVLAAAAAFGPPADVPAAAHDGAGSHAVADTGLFVTDTMIPMEDGVRLHARIWRPDPLGQPRRTIVSMTPYTLDDAQEYGVYFADRGYVYVNVDVRGRGSSGGEFWPLAQDGPDGARAVDWVARQEWSDGRVLMRGGSYRGMVQWQTLAAGPPEPLVSVVPTAAVHPGWDYPNPSGIFLSYATRWLGFVQGRASQGSLFGASDYWSSRYRILHREGRAFAELDEITGISGRVFERWIQHPGYDDYWRAMNPDSADYARIQLPILTITGHFDGDQPGAMKYYRDQMRHGTESATRRHYLVIGPWSHGGTRDPSKELGGLTFADTAVIDIEGLHDEWYRWVLDEGEKPAFLEDRVVYYQMGVDEWRSAPSLEAVSDTSVSFYLESPAGEAGDVFHSGRLARRPPDRADVDAYTYDPRDTARVDPPTEGGYTSGGAAYLDGPKLVYHSDPVDRPLTVAGYMRLEAWIEMDVPDTDMGAFVYEIRPDGTPVYMGQSVLRARYRNGLDDPEPVEPGRVERYVFDRFYWFAREVGEGSRIRLVIAPVNRPDLDKNYQSGGNTITETVEDARTGTIRLHSGPETPSRLVLPVADDGSAGPATATAQAPDLPPSGEEAAERLRSSPRHGEWVTIPAGSRDSVRAWVVYPEVSEPAPVVVVIHEIFGLTPWIRAVTDQLAAEGFIAVAPDLLTGKDVERDEIGHPEQESAVRAIRALEAGEVHRRLRAVSRWGTDLPAATDRYGVVGFCWGGSTSFAHATRDPELDAAVVYYGSSPEAAALHDVRAPVLGLYGGDDERVNSTVPRADSVLSALGRTYETRIYDGAGHGFLRQQGGRDGANRTATEAAWPETLRWFRSHLQK